jgi:hypothetical protein
MDYGYIEFFPKKNTLIFYFLEEVTHKKWKGIIEKYSETKNPATI